MRLALTASLLALPSLAWADLPGETIERDGKAHMVGLRFDYGAHGPTFGLEYYLAFESSQSRDGLGGAVWGGPGLSARYTPSGALVAALGGRVEMVGDAGGFGLEVTAGVGSDGDGPQGVATLGAFFGVYFFDVGYSYQLPLGPFSRPDWMSSHQLSLRLQVPVHRFDRSETRTVEP